MGEPHADRFAAELADETIIMTPATTQSLSFGSEGNAGNTDENFRENFAVENFRRRGRREDSKCAGSELGEIANPAGNDHARRSVEARVEYSAARSLRVGEDAISGNFVAVSFIEDDCGRVAVELARDHIPLDDFRPCRRALAVERFAARDHDRAKIFLFVRHSRCHGGSGFSCSMAPLRCRRARVSLSLSFSIRLTAGLCPRYVLSRKPRLRLKNISR